MSQQIAQVPPRWFLHAQTFERAGIMEVKGVEAHPTILSFFNHTTLKGHKLALSDETAWCSAFICAVMEQCGIRSTKSAAAASWKGWGEHCEPLRIGTIVVFNRVDKTNKNAAHVGLFAGIPDPEKPSMAVLGGNQNNRVCTKLYPFSDLVASRWPIGEE
jgi:uncharacterized protein (TIGR02594 family)